MAAPEQEQTERLTFVSCVCSFDDTCREPFTFVATDDDLARMRRTGRWPRSCGSPAHVSVHEQGVAANIAAKQARLAKQMAARKSSPEGNVMVAGRCRRGTCRKSYTVVMKAADLAASTDNLPTSCSTECGKALKRGKYKASKERREAAADWAAASPLTEAPVVVWPVPCRACWKEKPAPGDVMCTWCQQSARRCCFGKSRYDKETAVKRSRVSTDVTGETILPYRCPMCEQWHIGHEIPPLHAKKVKFTVEMYRELLSPEEWQQMCRSFAPLTHRVIRNRTKRRR